MVTEDQIIEKLSEDPDFKKSLNKFQEIDDKSQQFSIDISNKIVEMLDLTNENLTREEARFNFLTAKLAAAKLLATIASFNYEEDDFLEGMERARKMIPEEVVPMLMNVQPCGQCDNCKNGKKNECLNPKVREEACESRFLPLLSEALIEYDIWNEVLYNSIPADKKDVDILKDLDDDFHDQIVDAKPKKRGRPPKKEQEGE